MEDLTSIDINSFLSLSENISENKNDLEQIQNILNNNNEQYNQLIDNYKLLNDIVIDLNNKKEKIFIELKYLEDLNINVKNLLTNINDKNK